MLLHSSFKYFEPIKGPVPASRGMQFAYIADKARTILKNISRKTIDDLLSNTEFLINQNQQPYIYGDLELDYRTFFISPAAILKFAMRTEKRKWVDELTLNQWADHFAVLALALIGQSALFKAAELKKLRRLSDEEIAKEEQEWTQSLIADAAEAVDVAESLIEQARLEGSHAHKSLMRARPGGQAKHQYENNFRNMALEIYEREFRNREISNSQAASHIWNKIRVHNQKPDGTVILKPEGAVDRLARWIGQHKKAA